MTHTQHNLPLLYAVTLVNSSAYIFLKVPMYSCDRGLTVVHILKQIFGYAVWMG